MAFNGEPKKCKKVPKIFGLCEKGTRPQCHGLSDLCRHWSGWAR